MQIPLGQCSRALDLDQWLLAHGVQRRFRVSVPGFASFLQGIDLLATALGLLRLDLLRDLASAPVPMACPRSRCT